MKLSALLLMCLVLISASRLRPGVDHDADKPSLLADQQLKAEADSDNSAQPAIPGASQAPDSISPYEIKRYVEKHQEDEFVSLADYWNRLQIDVEEWEKYGRCEASIFELAIGRGAGPTVMLRLYDHSGWSMGGTRYLLFDPVSNNNETQWKLIGNVDLEDQRYEVPKHRILTSGSEHWIGLTSLAGRGSGYSLYSDEWYEITDDGLKNVLSYPASKWLSWGDPCCPALDSNSKIINVNTDTDRTTVTIKFTASYLLDVTYNEKMIKLWAKTQRAVFVRPVGQERFILDDLQSQLSKAELDAIYDGEGPSNDEIITYNVQHLERIASGTNEVAREWLRSFLHERSDTAEKERLLRALGQ